MAGNIAEVVANDPHIVKVAPSEYDSVPEVDESLFNGDVSLEVSIFSRFLGMPYVFDDFNDHYGERKPWLQDMWNAHRWEFWDYAVTGNALKHGNFAQIYDRNCSIVGMFADKYCGSDRDTFDSFVKQIKSAYLPVKVYDALPDSYKAVHAGFLKALMYGLLKFCEKKPVFQDAA
ncbi:hypothetical protein GF343_04515 [Candidatus Woesearchaeota archaeon]|nr:hypothetical protein [Candidatus Woesearchaeota archaeon]